MRRNSGGEKLVRAAERGDVEAINEMLDQVIRVDAARSNGWTALTAATGYGKAAVFELLMSRGLTHN